MGLSNFVSFINGIGTNYRFVISLKRIVFGLFLVICPFFGFAQQGPGGAAAGEFLIKYRRVSSPAEVSNKIFGKASLKASFPSLNLFHVALKVGPQGFNQNYEDLKNDPEIEYIEPNYYQYKNTDDGAVNQTFGKMSYSDVVDASSSISYSQSSTPVHVAEAWSYLKPNNLGAKVIVAVVDTGLDSNHQVFKPISGGGSGALWINPHEIPANGLDDDSNGFVDDVYGWNFFANTNNPNDDDNHGTHVSGIVVGTGIDILAQNLDESKILIMPLKFLGADGSGTTSNAIRAIYYAVNNGAKVINNSWGGPSYSKSLHDAFNYAYSHGVLLVNAAGNYSKDNDSVAMYPANLDVPSSISVAAVNNFDNLASFSNYGVTQVQVAAPGVGILSTVPGNYFSTMSGTSMASPFVAGVAALVFREAPQLTGFQVKSIIESSATVLTNLNSKVVGAHRIDALGAITAAKLSANTQSFQPDYNPDLAGSSRSPASAETPSTPHQSSGCGTIQKSLTSATGGGIRPNLLFFITIFAPLCIWYYMRSLSPANRRAHDRFKLNSEVRIKVGDRELVGSTKSISLGGVSFSADQALEKGGIVTMKISSPDGKDLIEVKGEVVWSEENQACGVRFNEAQQSTLLSIHQWTKSLVKLG